MHPRSLLMGFLTLAVGCAPDASEALDYEACSGGGECRSGATECIWFGTGDSLPSMCSAECVEDADCPEHESGRQICERYVDQETAVCVLACADGDDCAEGTSCVTRERLDESEVAVCQP